jgi:hypothetical protein
MPCSSRVRKIPAFAARNAGHKAGTFRSILTIRVPLGIRAQTWKNREWQSTPTPYGWSARLGGPFSSGLGEGNNAPVGALGATRLTGLNPGVRLGE